MFTIPNKTKMLIKSVTVVGENHGQDIQPGISLAIAFAVANDWLDNLAKGLKAAFYGKHGAKTKDGQQQVLDGVNIVSDLPNLRWPELGALTWGEEYSGRTLVLDFGGNDETAIRMDDVVVKAIRLEPLEGGSVEVTASFYSSTPDEHERGRLTSLIKSERMGLVLPPTVKQAEITALNRAPTKSKEPAPPEPGKALTPEDALAQAEQQALAAAKAPVNPFLKGEGEPNSNTSAPTDEPDRGPRPVSRRRPPTAGNTAS